MDEYIIY